jgi:uncharacterized protein (DUF488 family)
VRTVATIGVYGFTAQMFLDRLREADVGLLLDVRQRRGVRGSEYAWANSARLQTALAEAGIEYRHRKDLAPTTELRRLQYREDDRQGVGKRSRTQLAREYRERYVAEILDVADLDAVVAMLPTDRAAALMCVERDPEACHRSLIAERLAGEYAVKVTHLRPG